MEVLFVEVLFVGKVFVASIISSKVTTESSIIIPTYLKFSQVHVTRF